MRSRNPKVSGASRPSQRGGLRFPPQAVEGGPERGVLWANVGPEDSVELCLDGIRVHHGSVDLASANGDVVWVFVSLGERRLFHKDDGYELIRIRP